MAKTSDMRFTYRVTRGQAFVPQMLDAIHIRIPYNENSTYVTPAPYTNHTKTTCALHGPHIWNPHVPAHGPRMEALGS